jgi:hypothetical protein
MKSEKVSNKGYSVWTKTGSVYKFWTHLGNYKTKKDAINKMKQTKSLGSFKMLNQPIKVKKGMYISIEKFV